MAVIPQVLNDIFQSLSLIDSTTSPQIDWKETQEAHVFKVDVPGLNKEEVKVEVAEEGRFLQITGDIRGADKEVAQENDKWRRVERPRGKFCRRFLSPAENVKLDEVKACMENGVLTVTIPKKEIKKPQLKTIEITG